MSERERYVQTLKRHPIFENLIFELWKRYIQTLKTLYPNENVTCKL